MVRGDGQQTKVHFKGEDDDYLIIVESKEAVDKWKKDSSIPLIDVIASFDVFVTNKHGSQGELNRASKAQLENEFGTWNEDEVVKQLLEKGQVQEQQDHARGAIMNPNNGPGVGNVQ